MAYNFIECNREQGYLLPPDLREWLSEGDLVWFIIDAVEQMDLSKIYGKHRSDGWGRAGERRRPAMPFASPTRLSGGGGDLFGQVS